MTEVTDPLPADRGGNDGADGLSLSTRLCAGMRALEASAKQARQAGGGLVLAAPGPPVPRVLDLAGLTTGVPVYSSVEKAAGIASPQRAARPAPESGAQPLAAGLLTVRPGRQQEEGQRWPPLAAHRG